MLKPKLSLAYILVVIFFSYITWHIVLKVVYYLHAPFVNVVCPLASEAHIVHLCSTFYYMGIEIFGQVRATLWKLLILHQYSQFNFFNFTPIFVAIVVCRVVFQQKI